MLTATPLITKAAIICIVLFLIPGCFDDSKWRRIVLSVDVSPQGDLAAVRYFRDGVETIELSSNSRKCHWSVGGGGWQYRGIATFSPSGELVAIGEEQLGLSLAWGNIHRIILYDTGKCDRVRAISLGGLSEGQVLRFSPDGKYMAIASNWWLFQTGVNLAIIEVESGRVIKRWSYGDAEFPSLSLSDNGAFLAFGFVNLNSKTDDGQAKGDNDTGTILVLGIPSGDKMFEWEENGGKGVASVDIDSDQETVAVGLKDGTVKLVHYPTGENRIVHKFDGMVMDLQFSPSNELIFSAESKSNGSLVSYRTHTGEPVHNFSVQMPIFDFDLTDDGQRAIVGTSSGEIISVDLGESSTSER